MTNSLVLNIDQLRRALNQCLDGYERRHGTHVATDKSMYWLVEPEDAFALDATPALGVGDLADDLAEIEVLARKANDAIEPSPWHALGHLLGPLTHLASIR